MALQLGAQAGFDGALAAARPGGLGTRLLFLRPARVQERDLARYAEEVRRAEGPAGPGARHADARHRKALPLGELDARSEEHTSELQSLRHLVCRLLLEKKKNTTHKQTYNCTRRQYHVIRRHR